MRLADEGERQGILWLTCDEAPPHTYLVNAARAQGERVRELRWGPGTDGERSLGRNIEFGGHIGSREHPMSLKAVSPRVLSRLVRAREDTVVQYELGLMGLYSGLSKLVHRRRKVISLVENDYEHLGRTGTAGIKVMFRKAVAPLIDGFVANNEPAREYLIQVLGVPEEKISVGWWLAGLPPELQPKLPEGLTIATDRPVFVTACRLIAPKGVDLLLEAMALYQREHGPFQLVVLGEGPELENLTAQAERLGIADSVAFPGLVDHAGFNAVLQAAHVFVFPTLKDLVGRVVVEALTAGVPVIVSPLTGAVGTIVKDGVNGLVADPRDAEAMVEAMHRAVQPDELEALRAGVKETNGQLLPEAGAEAIRKGIDLARAKSRVGS
jgi:glycosyltransferase involved in cell wall biosynthesis